MKTTVTTMLLFILATTLNANRIDDLKTAKEVNSFLREQNKELKHFYTGNLESLYFDTTQRKIAGSFGVGPWQKVDFDSNGLTDLLVYGIWESQNCLIAVIDEGNKFNFCYLNRGAFDNLFFPVIHVADRHTYLILYKGCEIQATDCKVCCHDMRDKITDTITLIYKFGNFIELNSNPLDRDMEKIEFSTTWCFGTCPVFELEILPDRTAKYNAIQYNERKGKFESRIDTVNFREIIALLNYIDFPKLKDDYSVNWTDDQTSTFTITYNNGLIKKITDYAEMGTYGLRTLYAKLFELRENQQWK